MKKSNPGIGSVPIEHTTGRQGTFNLRKEDAIKKGHVSSPRLIDLVVTPVGFVTRDNRGNLQVGSNRPANL